jgi:hypothetical protein
LDFQIFVEQAAVRVVHNALHLVLVIFAMYKDVVQLQLAGIFVLLDTPDRLYKIHFVILKANSMQD